MTLRTLRATRYVTPLREGGSLPAIVEADDDGLYVLKFRAAGQGTRALIAELIAGEIGRALGIRVPEIVLVELDPALGRNEPDYEIRDLLTKSAGLNLALDYLPGSITFDPGLKKFLAQNPSPTAQIPLSTQDSALSTSQIVWLDAYTMNVDRTPRNPNLLVWHKNLWAIDHGAALYFHHQWHGELEKVSSPFSMIDKHVLLPHASEIEAADRHAHAVLTPATLTEILDHLPDEWLGEANGFATAKANREAYFEFLTTRLLRSTIFVQEVLNARA